MEGKPHIKDSWDKVKIGAEILKLLAVIWVGLLINTSLKSKEIDLKYVQLAVGILQSEPTKDSQYLRNWAVDIVNIYSEIDLNEGTKNELLQKRLIVVPVSDGMLFSDDMGFTDDGIIMTVEQYEKYAQPVE